MFSNVGSVPGMHFGVNAGGNRELFWLKWMANRIRKVLSAVINVETIALIIQLIIGEQDDS